MDDLRALAIYTTYSLIAFLSIEIEIAQALGWVILIDTILGILASILDRDEKAINECASARRHLPWFRRITHCYKLHLGRFKFKRLLKGFLSKITLLLIPILVAIGGVGLGYPLMWTVDSTIKIIIVSEILSSFNHIQFIRTGEKKPKQDIITQLINFLKRRINKGLEKLLKMDEEDDQYKH